MAMAYRYGHSEVIKVLLEKGIEPETKTDEEKNVFEYAGKKLMKNWQYSRP